MSYDDDKTRNLDAKLKLILQNAEKLTPEGIAAIKESLRVITEQAALLIKNPLRTVEEEQALQKAIEAGKYISDFVIDTRLALGHRMMGDATAIHEHIKKLAATGDEEAKKAASELDTLKKEMIKNQVNFN